jgi:hypothetical protein
VDNTYHAGKYIPCWKIHTMLENTYHAGKYIPCWKIHTMLDNTCHVFVARFIDFASKCDFDIFLELFQQCGIFSFSFHLHRMICILRPAWYVLSSMVCIVQHDIPCWKIHTMLDNTYHAGQYIPCWKIHTMLENAYHAGQSVPFWTMHTMLDNTYHAGQYIPITGISCEDLMKYPVSRAK